MKARFSLLFPYLCAFLVIAVIAWRGGQNSSSPLATHTDPVCHMEVGEGLKTEWRGSFHYFCTDICRQRFVENPLSKMIISGEVDAGEKILVDASDDELTFVKSGQTVATVADA